ncbi:MAG: ABC transporter substrate-binding protein [Thermodesulfobacteriota bacterium]
MKARRRIVPSGAGLVLTCVVALALSPAGPGHTASDPYVVGISGTVTGGAAGTYSPLSDGFRLYVETLNAKGGIGGRKIKLVFEDNAAQGVKAGANIKRFAGEKANLIVLSSPSGVYAPAFEETRRAKIPLLCMAIGPEQTIPPNKEPLIYGQVWGNAMSCTKVIVQIVKEQFASKVAQPVWGIGGVDIPVSRKGAEVQGMIGEKMGMKTVVKIAPLGMMDYTPIATAMMESGCNIVSTWGPAGLTLGLFRALAKLGYKGILYINTPDPPEHFLELMKEQPSIIYSTGQLIPITVDMPAHRTITETAGKHKVQVNSGLKWGWWYGMLVEHVFKKAGWPADTGKLTGILDHVDVQPDPAFAPVKFTPEDHQGPLFESGWSWSSEKNNFVPVLPWYVSNAAGTKIKALPKQIGFPKADLD